MTSPALREPLEGEHKGLEMLVAPSRLLSRRVAVRHQRRGAYAIDRPGRVALRRIRQGLGYSQHELSARAGVCVHTVHRVESGDARWLSLRVKAALARALRLRVERFEELFHLPIEGGEGAAA